MVDTPNDLKSCQIGIKGVKRVPGGVDRTTANFVPAGMPSLGIFRIEDARSLVPGRYLFSNVQDLDKLCSSNYRTIKEDDEASILLMDSIVVCGRVVEPIHLRVEDGKTSIIAGHRRVAVLKRIRAIFSDNGIPIPAYVEVVDAVGPASCRAVSAVITNLHRQELKPVERARGYQIFRESSMPIRRIAMLCGVDRKIVERSLAILMLRKEAIDYMEANVDRLKVSSLFRVAAYYKKTTRSPGGQKNELPGDQSSDVETSAHEWVMTTLREEAEPARPVQRNHKLKGSVENASLTVAREKEKRAMDAAVIQYREKIIDWIREALENAGMPTEVAEGIIKFLPST